MIENWYWIMPNSILFNEDLKDKEKLLFCFISSLCAREWYCWATNKYIAEQLNNKTPKTKLTWTTISRYISSLEKYWYIKTLLTYKWKQVINRKILLMKTSIPIDENINTPIDENIKDNITSSNIINKNINYRAFKHLKLSNEEFKKLNLNYSKEEIDNILNKIENYSWNKKYNSLYLTSIEWLKREFKENIKPKKSINWHEIEI